MLRLAEKKIYVKILTNLRLKMAVVVCTGYNTIFQVLQVMLYMKTRL